MGRKKEKYVGAANGVEQGRGYRLVLFQHASWASAGSITPDVFLDNMYKSSVSGVNFP